LDMSWTCSTHSSRDAEKVRSTCPQNSPSLHCCRGRQRFPVESFTARITHNHSAYSIWNIASIKKVIHKNSLLNWHRRVFCSVKFTLNTQLDKCTILYCTVCAWERNCRSLCGSVGNIKPVSTCKEKSHNVLPRLICRAYLVSAL